MSQITIMLMVVTLLSKILGFVRNITIAYFFGVSNVADAYLISLTIPLVLFGLLGAGISTGYIPLYTQIEGKNGLKEANKFTNNLLNILVLIITVIVVLGLVFIKQIIKIFAIGFEGETLKLAMNLTRISMIGIYFTGILFIFTRYLQIKGNYIAPALVGFPMNILILISIYISSFTNILVLAIGTVLATVSQVALLVPFLYKVGYRPKIIIDFKDQHIRRLGYMSLTIMIGISVNEINTLVDRTLASKITVGGIAALTYAERLNEFVYGIFILAIVTVLFPIISKMAVENNILGLKKSVSTAIEGISLLVIPASIGSMIFSDPIVRLLYGRGEFDEQAISMTAIALFFYSIGLLGFGLREIISKVFYSLQDTKTPMINATIAVMMNIVLNIVLSKYMGIGGLALATSISGVICTVLLYLSLKKKIGALGIEKNMRSLIKILGASMFMGLFAKLVFHILFMICESTNIALVVTIIMGILIYSIIIYFLRIESLDLLIKSVKRNITNKRVKNHT